MPESETPIFKSDVEQEAIIGAFNASMDARNAAANIGLEPQREEESDLEFVTRIQPDLDKDTIKKASDMGIETEDQSIYQIAQAMLDIRTVQHAKDIGIETENQSRDKIYKAVMDKDPQYFERSFYQ